jgi:aromatic-L-amino-acid decarboxylase
MNTKEFREKAHQAIDWICDYYDNIESFPVKSQVNPGDIYKSFPDHAPEDGEPFDLLINDLNQKILPGITHWQSPKFHAYFPANTSEPSILGELITSAIGAQTMKWETSPAAAELEEKVLNWIKDMMGLPKQWSGVIHDTASTATLSAIICARERLSEYNINNNGFSGNEKFRVYCSTEAHSSIEKDIKIAGIGKENLVKIPVDKNFAMLPENLNQAIEKDMKDGFQPLCVVAAIGTTSSTAIDPLESIAVVCEKHKTWLHIDAAYAGSALIIPEFRTIIKGIEQADSYVFNPHKWMFTNFDCSVFYVKDKTNLLNTFAILPEYLKTKTDGQVNDYCDWGIQLGRRFRALKLWFVIRTYGVNGIRERIKEHINLALYFASQIQNHGFELLAPVNFNLVCFRYNPGNKTEEELNSINENMLQSINSKGNIYITHTKLNGKYTLRFISGQTYVEKRHVDLALEEFISVK